MCKLISFTFDFAEQFRRVSLSSLGQIAAKWEVSDDVARLRPHVSRGTQLYLSAAEAQEKAPGPSHRRSFLIRLAHPHTPSTTARSQATGLTHGQITDPHHLSHVQSCSEHL